MDCHIAPAATPDSTERRWAALAVVCAATACINLDLTVVNVAVPAIARGVSASADDILWIVTAYGLAFACVLPAAGALADRFGHRRAFLTGTVWFGLSSAIAATAGSPAVLTFARLGTGVGAAVVYPTTLAIIGDMFPDGRERQRAISFWVGIGSIGLVLGPVFGGDVIDRFGWSSAFLISPLVCVFIVGLGLVLVPRDRNKSAEPVDVVGVVVSALGLAAVLYAAIEGPQAGFLSLAVPATFALGAALFVAFVWWESHIAHPMVEFGLFRNREFAAGTLALAIPYFALPAWGLFLSLYLQFVLGASAFVAGLVIAPAAVGQLCGAILAPSLMRRLGANVVAATGATFSLVAVAFFVTDRLTASLPLISFDRFVDGLGLGLLVIPATDAVLRGVSPSREGVGIAVSTATRSVASIIGVALIGSLMAVSYRWKMGGADYVPDGSRQKAVESIRASVDAARSLAPDVSQKLLRQADAAYSVSFRLATVVTVVGLIVTIFATFRLLPGREAVVRSELDVVRGP